MTDYRLFPTNPTPTTPDAGFAGGITVGVRFKATAAAKVTTIWFYKAAANTGTHVGGVWNAAGTLQSSVTFSGETASGWQSMAFGSPITLTIGEIYTAGVLLPVGHFPRTPAAHTSSITSGILYAPSNAESSPQSCYVTGATLTRPTIWESTDSYGIDVTIADTPARTAAVQAGSIGASVDFLVNPNRQAGFVGVNVDLVAGVTYPLTVSTTQPQSVARGLTPLLRRSVSQPQSVALLAGPIIRANAVRWSGSVFEMDTASPLTYWSAGAFQSSGTASVIWNTDHFELAP